jgi:hypothetical protein
LVLFTRTPNGWRRSQLTGVHEPGLIRQFIRREIVSSREAGDVPTRPVSAGAVETSAFDESSSVQ